MIRDSKEFVIKKHRSIFDPNIFSKETIFEDETKFQVVEVKSINGMI